MAVHLLTSPLDYVREIAIQMQIVNLVSFVNNAQELKQSQVAWAFLNPAKIIAEFLIRPHRPLRSQLMQSLHLSLPIRPLQMLLLHQRLLHHRFNLCSLTPALLPTLFPSVMETVTMIHSVKAT